MKLNAIAIHVTTVMKTMAATAVAMAAAAVDIRPMQVVSQLLVDKNPILA